MSQTLAVQTFGDFQDEAIVSREYLTIVFSPSSLSLRERWRTNRLSANFLADYFSTFFPGEGQPAGMSDPKSELMGVITFIANELLENAMKYSDATATEAVMLTLQLYPDRLVFLTKNQVNAAVEVQLLSFIKTLLVSDPAELYIQQIEQQADADGSTCSGLGILTIVNDYMARVGWLFETVEGVGAVVTTKVQLEI
ncbi:MAG: ATP-binding protein [Leptolyngbya sp. DLM2.Bin27]|nr:MAG: ATP-binding protein [Leptolyngbya sp. DLM2.Bin27]